MTEELKEGAQVKITDPFWIGFSGVFIGTDRLGWCGVRLPSGSVVFTSIEFLELEEEVHMWQPLIWDTSVDQMEELKINDTVHVKIGVPLYGGQDGTLVDIMDTGDHGVKFMDGSILYFDRNMLKKK